MEGHIIGTGNGSEPTEPQDIVIVLRLKPTPHGYQIGVEHAPGVFTDTVIDACQRAARYYERIALMQEMAGQAQQQVRAQSAARRIRESLS